MEGVACRVPASEYSSWSNVHTPIIHQQMQPVSDKVSTALYACCREARAEAEALRERLAAAEVRAAKLASQNATMRERLGNAAGEGMWSLHMHLQAC